MIASTDYPDLRNFIECTFHQDWDETPGTYEAVVDGALAPEPADYLRKITADAAGRRLHASELHRDDRGAHPPRGSPSVSELIVVPR